MKEKKSWNKNNNLKDKENWKKQEGQEQETARELEGYREPYEE